MSEPKPRQPAPELAFETLDGSWELGARNPERFTMVVVYRGLHCPLCKESLRKLERKLDDFTERGVEIITVSGDSRERAERTRDEWEIRHLGIGYGLTESMAQPWGLYVSTAITDKEPDRFFEPGLFLVKPDGVLYAAWIQSVPFARPDFDDVLSVLDFIEDNDYPARGDAAPA